MKNSETDQTKGADDVADVLVYVSPIVSLAEQSLALREKMHQGNPAAVADFLALVNKNLGPKFTCFWQQSRGEWVPIESLPAGSLTAALTPTSSERESWTAVMRNSLDRTLLEHRAVGYFTRSPHQDSQRSNPPKLTFPDAPSNASETTVLDSLYHTISAPLYWNHQFLGIIACLFEHSAPAIYYRADLLSILAGIEFAIGGISSSIEAVSAARESLLLRCTACNRYTDLAYTISNELRDFLPCDRVTLVDRKGDTFRVMAVSGQPHFDRRSSTIQQMERLAAVAAKTLKPVFSADDHLASPIRESLEAFIDETQCRAVIVLPLLKSHSCTNPSPQQQLSDLVNGDNAVDRELMGVLIVETMESVPNREQLLSKYQSIEIGMSNLIATSKQHHRLIGMPLWQKMSWLTELFTGNTKRKAIAITAAMVTVIAALGILPAELRIRCEGVLTPRDMALVFPRAESIIEQVLVRDGEVVAKGQPLAKLNCIGMRAELHLAQSELGDVEERYRQLLRRVSVNASSIEAKTPRDTMDSDHIDLAAAREKLKPLQARVRILSEELSKVETIVAPISGMIFAWNIEQRLTGRPVNPGERLFNIAALESPLILELEADDFRYGYITRANQQALARDEALQVDFKLASNPYQQWSAQVASVGPTTDINAEKSTILPIKANIVDSIAELQAAGAKAGTSVTGRIHCGRASLIQCKLYSFFDWARLTWFKYVG